MPGATYAHVEVTSDRHLIHSVTREMREYAERRTRRLAQIFRFRYD
jgi:hypothetical protein